MSLGSPIDSTSLLNSLINSRTDYCVNNLFVEKYINHTRYLIIALMCSLFFNDLSNIGIDLKCFDPNL